MTSSRVAIDVAALQAKGLRRCSFYDLFESTPSGEDREKIDAYFRAFLPPQKECPGCGAQLTGSVLGLLDSFEWGLAHGEGRCADCGYPARAYHFLPEAGINRLSMVLAYHPDELRATDAAKGGAE